MELPKFTKTKIEELKTLDAKEGGRVGGEVMGIAIDEGRRMEVCKDEGIE